MIKPRRAFIKTLASTVSSSVIWHWSFLSAGSRDAAPGIRPGKIEFSRHGSLDELRNAADHNAFFDALIQSGGGTVPWLGFTWILTRRWVGDQFPTGTELRIEPSPSGEPAVQYRGKLPSFERGERWGLFEIGDNCVVSSSLDEVPARVSSTTPAPNLWVVVARGKTRWSTSQIQSHNMGCVHAMAAVNDYAAVVMDGPHQNCSCNFVIRNCGGDFDQIFPALREGIITVRYSRDWKILGGSTLRGPHGFQGWGGDARTDGMGQGHNPEAEKKCRNGQVVGFRSQDVQGAWAWGSFMENVDFIDCTGQLAGDVGFDFEGCKNCRAINCRGEDAVNGGLTTFFHNEAIAFINCSIISSRQDYPIFRNYNVSQSNQYNLDISILGGQFECTDSRGLASIDTLNGCCNLFVVKGISGKNIRIDTAHNNMHETRILDNELLYTRAFAAFSAIRAGFAKSLAGSAGKLAGSTVILDNIITSHENQAPSSTIYGTDGDYGSVAIDAIEDDYNSSARCEIRNNKISEGFLTSILLRNWSRNPGVVPVFDVRQNRIFGKQSGDHKPIHATHDNIGKNGPRVVYSDNYVQG